MVANAFVDDCMDKISDAAVKIYLIIVRKTRGWTKECDALSLTQLEELSKKSRPTVVRCLKELVSVGLVKKHHQSVHGNVYSLIDNYFIGVLVRFPSKKSLLVKAFSPRENDLVKNFNYPKISPKPVQKVVEIRLNFPSKKFLLVKSFYHTSKNILPLLVKIFNTQKTLSININQNKKRGWLDFKILKDQIVSAHTEINVYEIFNAEWFNRELEAFEEYNAEKKHSDKFQIYFFADWLLKARAKYAKMKTPAPRFSENKFSGQQVQSENSIPDVITFASDKQLYKFAKDLVFHPKFKDSFCGRGEGWMDAAKRMAALISDPEQQKPYIPYLIELGFKQTKGNAA